MSAPRYFIPGDYAATVNVELLAGLLEGVGLGYVFEDRERASFKARTVLGPGPDGNPGIIIVSVPVDGSRTEEDVGYYPDRQTWTEGRDGSFWLGIENDSPPSSMDLLRRGAIPGHFVPLNDGGSWMIPLARVFPKGSSNLPTVVLPGDDGSISYEVKAEYRSISDAAARIASVFFVSPDSIEIDENEKLAIETEIDDEEYTRVAMEALAMNYRVSPLEVRVLELLTVEGLRQIALALIDFPKLVELMEIAKKKPDSSGSRSSVGSGDSSSVESTDRPSENSKG